MGGRRGGGEEEGERGEGGRDGEGSNYVWPNFVLLHEKSTHNALLYTEEDDNRRREGGEAACNAIQRQESGVDGEEEGLQMASLGWSFPWA